MKKIFCFVLVLCALTSGSLRADDAPPWTPLFNGKDLSGWSIKGGGGKAYVDNGEIVCHVTANTTEHTFVCTNDAFTDFIFEMDVKIDGDFNTGISFRAIDALPDAPVKLWSYMVKIDPTSRHWTGGIFEDFGTVWQWLYTMENNAPGREAFKIREWNHFRIEALGSHFKVWVNGVPTANLIDERYARGYIAMKIHWTGNFPEREKILAHFKNPRIITDHPERFAQETTLPLTTTADKSGITVPPGFRALLVADNLVGDEKRPDDKLQFLAVGGNSEIYAKTSKGGIFVLRSNYGDSHADVIKEFGTGGGTGIAFHAGWLYYSTPAAIYRYKYTRGTLTLAGEPELIVKDLPVEPSNEAKPFAFDDQGRLLVAVGSPANGKDTDPAQASKIPSGFWRFDANKANQTFADGFHYATGIHDTVSLAWNPASKTFFTVTNSTNQPAEELHRLDEGTNLQTPDTAKSPDPLVTFPAHWISQQMLFYPSKEFAKKYRGGAFIAFHGSSNPALPQDGCNVCFVPFDNKGNPTGTYEIFADGFAGNAARHTPTFRPCGLAIASDGTLYIGDSEKGRIWRILYTGQP